MFTFCGGVKV